MEGHDLLCSFRENSYCSIETRLRKQAQKQGDQLEAYWQYQVRDDGGMDQGGDSGGGDDCSNSGCILQREPADLLMGQIC